MAQHFSCNLAVNIESSEPQSYCKTEHIRQLLSKQINLFQFLQLKIISLKLCNFNFRNELNSPLAVLQAIEVRIPIFRIDVLKIRPH